ncbi:MAG: metallophosphoesterase [Bacteroidales bacterium]
MNDLYFFVSDLHGSIRRYEKLFLQIEKMRPRAVFFGGDLLPAGLQYLKHRHATPINFVSGFLAAGFRRLKDQLGGDYPDIFIIPGNDDPKSEEAAIQWYEQEGLWHYMHMKQKALGDFTVYGYAMVPPTPFMLKDWERYDVSRYVDPGCVHPHEGYRTAEPDQDVGFATIKQDLERLTGQNDLSKAIFLFHTPPYKTSLDRAGLDGVMVDHVPVDVHVGSIAVKEFIEKRQPMLTLHGHIHESSKITGSWKQKINNTMSYSAANDSSALTLVQFTGKCLMSAERLLL